MKIFREYYLLKATDAFLGHADKMKLIFSSTEVITWVFLCPT